MGSIAIPTPSVHTISSRRIFPFSKLQHEVIKTLSITDSAVAGISGPEAIWFYDSSRLSETLSPETLTASLEKTLSSYPFFAGRLAQISFEAGGDWTKRQGRLQAIYGRHDDPGIAFAIAACDEDLADVVPNKRQRGRIWDSSSVPFAIFAGDKIHMALHDGQELGDAPLMRVKITTFRCGGVAIATKIVHPLADAQTMTSFVMDWSNVHAFRKQSSYPILDPELFTGATAGDPNAPSPDPHLVENTRALPIHRYDFWASADGCPEFLLWRTKIAPEVKASGVKLPHLGTSIPWADLDIKEPISHYNIQFSAQEVERIHKAGLGRSHNDKHDLPRISRLDALLSHIWTLLIRARRLPADDEIFLNMIVNFRSRINPSLPKSFVGTPAILAYAKSTVKDATGSDSVQELSTQIRSTVNAFTPTSIPAFLHDAAHQIEPKRYWQTFIGCHHVTATSWLHHNIHDIDFGTGQRPRYVEPVMPPYLVCVTEPDGGAPLVDCQPEETGHKPWYAEGANVSLHFETKVMDRLLQDPQLRAFDY